MTRREDWLQRLWDTIDAWKARPFEWGTTDCCKFCAACVDAICDSAFTDALTYTNEAEARAWIASAGSLQDAVSDQLGLEPQVGYPRRGDVVLIDTPDGPGIGICVGSAVLIAGAAGIVSHPMTSRPHWRIG